MQLIHYLMLALTAVVAVCPVIGQQVPAATATCAILASLAGALLGVLAQISPQAALVKNAPTAPVPDSPPEASK